MFNTPLFLCRAEGWLSPHYSLNWEAETGSVERKDKEMNPLERISINHSITQKNTSAPHKIDENTHKHLQAYTRTNARMHLDIYLNSHIDVLTYTTMDR